MAFEDTEPFKIDLNNLKSRGSYHVFDKFICTVKFNQRTANSEDLRGFRLMGESVNY